MTRISRAARLLLVPSLFAAALIWASPEAAAQDTQQVPAQTQTSPTPTPQTQTPAQGKTETQTANRPAQQQAAPQAEKAPASQSTQTPAQPAAPAEGPLYRDFKGVKVGTSREEARRKLGSPQEKDQTQDFFVFSARERARVYYDDKGQATAVIVTYIGKSADAPAPKTILGTDIEAKQDGSMYKIVYYPQAGYWVAYSRTAGDDPLTMITMQKIPAASQ